MNVDKHKAIKEYVDLFTDEDTDCHPTVPCTEKEFIQWSLIYIGNKNISNRVLTKLKKLNKVKGE